MKVTSEMYTKMFNAITDAKTQLEKVTELLSQVQSETEEIYINQEEE